VSRFTRVLGPGPGDKFPIKGFEETDWTAQGASGLSGPAKTTVDKTRKGRKDVLPTSKTRTHLAYLPVNVNDGDAVFECQVFNGQAS
jgi:hypothetical protein